MNGILFAESDPSVWVTGFIQAAVAAAAAWVTVKVTLSLARKNDTDRQLTLAEDLGKRRAEVDGKLGVLEREVSAVKEASQENAETRSLLEGLQRDLQKLERTVEKTVDKIFDEIRKLVSNPTHSCSYSGRIVTLEVQRLDIKDRVQSIESTLRKCASCRDAAGSEGERVRQ